MRHDPWTKVTDVTDESNLALQEREVSERAIRIGSSLCTLLYMTTIAYAFASSGGGYGQAMFVLFYVMLPAGVIGTIWSLFLLLQGLYLGGDARLIGVIPFALYAGSIALVFMGILE